MRSLRKLSGFGLGLLLACGACFRAAGQEPDTAYMETAVTADTLYDSDEYSDDEAYESEDESQIERTPRVIIYNTQRPAEGRWLEVTSDDAYNYRTTREYVPQPPAAPQPMARPPWWIRAIVAFMKFITTPVGLVILWTLLVLLVAYIVYRIIGGDGRIFGRRDLRPDTPADTGELSEEGLMEPDWDGRMRSALEAGEQRQAIRFGYLHLLQQLQTRQLIRFSPDKTNIAYYRELPEPLRPGFRNLSRVYEFAWYGNFLPDPTGMTTYVSQLENFLLSAPRL